MSGSMSIAEGTGFPVFGFRWLQGISELRLMNHQVLLSRPLHLGESCGYQAVGSD